MSASLAPAEPKEILAALATLSTLVARREQDPADLAVQLRAYTDRLLTYPGDVALSALNDWPSMSQWWPTWFELQERMDAMARWRRSLDLAIEQLMETSGAPLLAADAPAEETEAERRQIGKGLRALAQSLASEAPKGDVRVVSLTERLAARKAAP